MMNEMMRFVFLALLLPLLLGLVPYAVSRKKAVHIVNVFAPGFVIELALFFLVSVRMVLRPEQYTLDDLIGVCRRVFPVVVIVVLVVDVLHLVSLLIWKEKTSEKPRIPAPIAFFLPDVTLLAAGALILLSLFCVAPHLDDWTPEHVQMSLESRSLYNTVPTQYDLGSSQNTGAEEPALPYFYLVFAVVSEVTGMSALRLIHFFGAGVLLLFFFAAWAHMGHMLFPKEEDSVKRRIFFLIAAGFFAAQLLVDAYLAGAVFQNIWNATTLGASCILPLTVVYAVKLSDWIVQRKKSLRAWLEGLFYVLMLATVLAVLALTLVWGQMFWALIVGLALVSAVGRRIANR